MKTIELKLCEISTKIISIGFEGEQNHTRIAFDASALLKDYPDATASLAVKPPVGAIYPVAVQKDGNSYLWNVTGADCANNGNGEYQLTFFSGEEVIKSFIGYFRVYNSLVADGTAPDPVSDWIEEANKTLEALEDISASSSSLPAGSPATAEITDVGGHKNIAIGIPAGEPGTPGRDGVDGKDGKDGAPGKDGSDGFSPVISVSDITGGHRVSITDAEGTESFDVMDGAKGDPGTPGAPGHDGFSPTATVTKSGDTATITITDKNGTTTAQVSDGNPATLIDDSSTAANKAWSAQKTNTEVSTLKNEIDDLGDAVDAKYTKPQTGIPASDLASGVIPSVPVQDVQINGTSILSQGVANIPATSTGVLGASKINNLYGVTAASDGTLMIYKSSDAQVKTGTEGYRPIVPGIQHASAFYGLAKAAGNTDQASSANAVGVYTDDAKLKIQQMIGLWEPKCYLKYTQEEDANNTDTISFNQQDVPIEIYEELVIIVYQSDEDNGQVIMSNDWGYINVRDAINSAYLTSNNAGYMRGNKPAVLKFKRYPGCVIGEVLSGGATADSTYAWVRSSDYLDKMRFIQMGCSGGLIKAGTTIEAYIHRFI